MLEQLTLDLRTSGVRAVVGRRHVRADGPGRLLLELARRGLRPEDLPAAAALVLELDAEAAAR
jgi:hypothetical protein